MFLLDGEDQVNLEPPKFTIFEFLELGIYSNKYFDVLAFQLIKDM